MKPHHFIKQIDHDRLQKAIQEAENGNIGDIVIHISHHQITDPYPAAEKAFQQLGQGKPPDHVTLLFFIVPNTRKFAVIGSQALHDKVGEIYWQNLVNLLSTHFKSGRYTDGLIEAVASAGQEFQKYFPGKSPELRGPDIVED